MEIVKLNDSITLIHADCADVISSLAYDAVITDPPYGTTDIHFDNNKPNSVVFSLLAQHAKPNSYLISFGGIELLSFISEIWKIRFPGVWLKQAPVIRKKTAKKPMSEAELYCVYAHPKHKVSNLVWNKQYKVGTAYKKIQRNNGYKRDGKDSLSRATTSGWTKDGYESINTGMREETDVIKANNKTGMKHSERTTHPTQKPISLLSVLIKWTTNENDTILDPFMGSGSTGVACIESNRKFIGIENNKEYFDIAHARLIKILDSKTQRLI